MANVSSSNGIEKRPKLQFSRSSRWQSTCLDCICNIKMGQSPDSLSYNSDSIGLPLVQGNADITDRVTTPTRFTSQPTKIAVEGDIIMSVRAPVGTVSVANQDVCCGRGVCSIRVKNNCLQEFLYQLLLLHEEDWRNVEQGGTFKAISGDDIRSFSVNIPSLSEQEKIASFLEKVDERIRIQKRIIETLKKYKRGVSKRFFDEIHNDQNCEAKQFSEVFELIQNNTFSRECLTDENTDVLNVHYGDILVKYGSVLDPDIDTVPFIKSGTDLSKFSGSSYLQDGDVIFADTAEDYTVGKMCEIINVSNRKILSGLHTMPFRPTITFAPMYLGYYLNSAAFRTQILPMIQGAKVSSISKSEMKNTIIHIPSIERQTEIVGILNALDKRIKRTELILAELKEMKKGLLQNLFI